MHCEGLTEAKVTGWVEKAMEGLRSPLFLQGIPGPSGPPGTKGLPGEPVSALSLPFGIFAPAG